MILLDAYAVLALLKGEPASPHVDRLLERGEARLTALGVAEVVDHLVRLVGTSDDDAALDLAQLGLEDPEPVSVEVALQTGLLRAHHYDRRARAVSLADCVVAATAHAAGAAIATADPHLLDLCRAEGIDVVPLPDSNGVTWKD